MLTQGSFRLDKLNREPQGFIIRKVFPVSEPDADCFEIGKGLDQDQYFIN